MAELVYCKACNSQISSEATACPKCGHPLKESASDTPIVAKKNRKKKFVHAGCLVYIIGWLIAGSFVAFLNDPISGEDGGLTVGQVIGFIIFVLSIAAGLPMSKDWFCGNWGTRLSNKKVKLCPACKATFK